MEMGRRLDFYSCAGSVQAFCCPQLSVTSISGKPFFSVKLILCFGAFHFTLQSALLSGLQRVLELQHTREVGGDRGCRRNLQKSEELIVWKTCALTVDIMWKKMCGCVTGFELLFRVVEKSKSMSTPSHIIRFEQLTRVGALKSRWLKDVDFNVRAAAVQGFHLFPLLV